MANTVDDVPKPQWKTFLCSECESEIRVPHSSHYYGHACDSKPTVRKIRKVIREELASAVKDPLRAMLIELIRNELKDVLTDLKWTRE